MASLIALLAVGFAGPVANAAGPTTIFRDCGGATPHPDRLLTAPGLSRHEAIMASHMPEIRTANEPDSTLRMTRGGTVSYGDLAERVRRISASLHAAGLRPGDRVLFVVRPGPEAIAWYFK